jgi:hypothetical protein
MTSALVSRQQRTRRKAKLCLRSSNSSRVAWHAVVLSTARAKDSGVFVFQSTFAG